MDRVTLQPSLPPTSGIVAPQPPDSAHTPRAPTHVRNAQLPPPPALPRHDAMGSWLHDQWVSRRTADATAQARSLLDAVHANRRALHPQYFPLGKSAAYQTAWQTFVDEREKVIAEAAHAVRQPAHYLPRPYKALPDTTSTRTFLSAVFLANPQAKGLVIGEAHGHATPKQLLIRALPTLREQGVSTLYLEHVPADALQLALDACSEGNPVPLHLRRHLDYLDQGHCTQTGNGFADLVVAVARFNQDVTPAHRIHLVAVDTMATYFLQGTDDACRTAILNIHAERTIAQRQHTPRDRFIALVGNSHTDLWQGEVGLGQRLGVPTAHVMDCAAEDAFCGPHPGIEVERRTLPPTEPGTLRADYLLKAPVLSRPGQ